MLVLDLLEVGVCEEDARHDVFFRLNVDVVADVVGVFAEAEDGRVDEFGDCATEREGEADYAGPEVADVGADVFVGEEDDWERVRMGFWKEKLGEVKTYHRCRL